MYVGIARKCRDFVKKYEYKSWRNPSIEGDLRAVELANKMVIKEEVEETFGVSDEEYHSFSPAGGSDNDNNFSEDNEKDGDYKPEVKGSTRDFGFTKGGRKRRNMLAPSKLPVTCHLCNKTLSNQHCLTTHLDIVHQIKTSKTFSYPFCTYAKKSPKDQQEALVIPGCNIFRVKCPVSDCPETWSSIPPYLIHMENEHTSEEKCGITSNAKVLECTECQKMFRTLEHLEDHLPKHDKTLKRDQICEFCGAAFVTKRRLLTHKHVKAECRERQGLKPKEKEPALCTICGKTFPSKKSLSHHVYKCHRKSVPKPPKKPVNCHLCSKQICSAKNLKLHLFLVHQIGKGNYECPKCQKSFPNKSLLNRHTRRYLCGSVKKPKAPCGTLETRNMNPKKPLPDNKFSLKCPVSGCPQTWSDANGDISNYRSHLATQHTKEEKAELVRLPKYLECLECGKSFRSFDRGHFHLYEHDKTLKTPIVCDTCGKGFLYKANLKVHQETSRQCGKQKDLRTESGPSERIICDICGNGYATKISLQRHIRYAHKGNKETSRQCGKEMKLTESEAKIICDICGNGYANKNSLQSHIRKTHKGIKPRKCKVVCDVCGISLASTSLYQHKQRSLQCRRLQGITESEAKIICNICGNGYSNRITLQKHIRERHEGIFAQTCGHCGKGLESKTKLNIHLAIVHKIEIESLKGKEHKCPEEGCGKVFYSKKTVTNHWYGVHKQGEPGFKCEQCGKAFYAPGYLSQHINVVHKGYRWKPKSKKEKVVIESNE